MLNRREECDTYMTHVCRDHYSGGNPEKRKYKIELSANTVAFISYRYSLVLAESSLYFIFSPGSLHYADVYRHESRRCRILPFFLRFHLSRFSFYVKIWDRETLNLCCPMHNWLCDWFNYLKLPLDSV